MEKWNKALDIPVEILFKYLCRDYRREQARTAELEKKVQKLQAELNYERNNTPTVEKLQRRVSSLQTKVREQEGTIKARNLAIKRLKGEIGG
jgi:peptidoglycan hydrolase CwlO-like protein